MPGIGGLGSKGHGTGSSSFGTGGGGFGAHAADVVGATSGSPIILGALDKSLVDAVIKRHLNAIRYCYERELRTNPSLTGKVVVKFVIAKDGTVATAEIKSSTLTNSPVEQCLVGRFIRMQFPAPAGGGIVVVSYPFLFTSTP